MIKVKNIVAAALAAACVVSFSSCGEKLQGVDRPSGETALEMSYAEGDFEFKVTKAEYDYYYLNFLAEGAGAEQASEKTLAELKRIGAIFSLAEEYDVSLGKEEREAVENELEATIEGFGGKKQFEEGLAEFNMTRELYLSLSQFNSLEIALRTFVTDEVSGIIKSDDATVEKDISENFIAAKQILISNDDGDDVDENRKLAAELADRLSAGEDFDSLAAEYGEDEDMDPVYGRYFTHGMYPEVFESTAEKLSVGETSGVVESEIGFHIILRMPIDDGYVDENFNKLRYYFLNRSFNEMVEERMGQLSVAFND